MAVKIQIRRGTAAQWTAANPVLIIGELGFETDTNLIKAGNGTSAWSALAYYTGASGTTAAGTLTGATLAANVTASSLISLGTLTTVASGAYELSSSGISAKTASYSLVAGDNGKIITMNVASANTLTVPASLAVGFNCTIIQLGAGQTTITASGTTLNSLSGFLKISAQHGSASLISYVSNVYNVAGSLSA